jgi:hypothetical protein
VPPNPSLKAPTRYSSRAWPLQAKVGIVLAWPAGVCLHGRLSSNVRPHSSTAARAVNHVKSPQALGPRPHGPAPDVSCWSPHNATTHHLLARLSFALIGFVLGAMLGVLLWWLFGFGFHRIMRPTVQPDAVVWVKYTGGICALIGFLFKDRVGEFVGSGIRAVFSFELESSASGWHAPRWLVLLVIAAAAYAAWYFAS